MFFIKGDKIEICGGMVLKDPDGKRWLVAFSHKGASEDFFVLVSEPFDNKGCCLRSFEYTQNYEGVATTYRGTCSHYTRKHLASFVRDGGWSIAENSEKFAQQVIQKQIEENVRLESKYQKAIDEIKRIRDSITNLEERAKIDMFLDVETWQDIFRLKEK